MPAAEALSKLRMPEGFQATLFAAEPDVQNPIACTWDRKGRLWVAENYTYAEREKRFDLSMNDRVIILEDKDNDGRAETRKVFTDQVKMLTSVELAPDGVYLMCPPQLLFIPDKNHDDVPDGPPEVILDGFDVAKNNYHNFANGLRFGPDGWLYGRCGHSCPARIGKPGTPDNLRVPMDGGIWRYHPQRGIAEVVCSGTTNPWGHDWDENGEMFFANTVIGHIWHSIPGAYFNVPSGPAFNPGIYERIDQIADHYHWDTGKHWMESRDGKANDLGGGHSHIGSMIYQADQWPEKYRGKYFTLNQHGRRINVERIEQDGTGYVAKHEPDMILSDDPWFRGIDLTTGPDGSVFVLDWSDTGECHDHTGVHRESGRIYKFSYGKPGSPETALLDDLSPDGVEKIVRHPNAWFFRTLNVVFSGETLPPEIISRLREIADSGSPGPIRLRAFSLLQSHDQLGIDAISRLVKSDDEHLQVFGLRALVDGLPLDRPDGTVVVEPGTLPERSKKILTDALSGDTSDLGILALASSLQRLPPSERGELLTQMSQKPYLKDNLTLSHLLWTARVNTIDDVGVNIASFGSDSPSDRLRKWSARFLASHHEKYPDALAELLKKSAGLADKLPVVEGLSQGFEGISSAPMPDSWAKFAGTVSDPKAAPLVSRLSILFGDTSTIDSLKSTVLDDKAAMADRQQALDILIDSKTGGLGEIYEKVIAVPILNGSALRGLHQAQDADTAKLVLANYEHFLPADRPALFDTLVGRPDWAGAILDAIAGNKIPKTDLPAFSALRIKDLKQPGLTERLTEVWGSVNASPEGKKQEIAARKAELTTDALSEADLGNGHKVFTASCATCHMLKGEGGVLGPDLTGSGRANIDYLLENIIAPSSVVPADYRMTVVTLKDGRSLAGAISSKTDKTLTLRLPTGEDTVPLADITDQITMETSMMPEGLLTTLTPEQVRDLIAFLMKTK